MERDEPTIKGWQAFKGRFLFGASAQTLPPPEIVKRGDETCSQEPMGNGGFIAQCDFDRLDQQ